MSSRAFPLAYRDHDERTKALIAGLYTPPTSPSAGGVGGEAAPGANGGPAPHETFEQWMQRQGPQALFQREFSQGTSTGPGFAGAEAFMEQHGRWPNSASEEDYNQLLALMLKAPHRSDPMVQFNMPNGAQGGSNGELATSLGWNRWEADPSNQNSRRLYEMYKPGKQEFVGF